MVKLLLCLGSGALLAMALLQLRQQRLNLDHEQTELHQQIKAQEAQLWNQQLQIAVYTAPNAIAQTVNTDHFKMVPETAAPGRRSWTEQTETPDAE
jgi:cell division protein FtsL